MMNSSDSRPSLPMVPESERYLLGCLLTYQECVGELFSSLRTTDFVHDRAHLAVFSVANDFYRRGESIDPQLVAAQLKGNSNFKDIDPNAFLLELMHESTTRVHIPVHIRLLREATAKRKLHLIASDASSNALNGKPAQDIIRSLAGDLFDLEREYHDTPAVISAADVESRPVEWLWLDRLPRGELTILDGDPGTGKSQIACYIAGCVSYARPFPYSADQSDRVPGNVLMLACEDNYATTTRPRLEAAGADLDRVFLWPDDDLIGLPSGVPRLAAAVTGRNIRLLVIDPLTAYLDESINSNRDADVRRALRPVFSMAQETGVAVLVIRHLNKDATKPSLYRGGGSIGFIASSRMAWIVGRDPEQPDRRILAINKCNLVRHAPSLAYEIEPVDGVSCIRWLGESSYTPADILAERSHRPKKRDVAKKLIAELLATGPRAEAEVRAACEAAAIGTSAYRAARRDLGIKPLKAGMADGWVLALPDLKICQTDTQ